MALRRVSMAKARWFLVAAFCSVVGVALVSRADAGGPPRSQHNAPPADPYAAGYVVAESRFGHGTVSGPVRLAPRGYEVRLPGGTWIACRRSCSETLRVESVDFWENRGAGRGAIDNECGLFGCLSRSLGF
jgi:hypothetical protein